MRLEIKNFAKIKQADIIIDGITVIAGENNTGKSTIGKILFALFNSLSNVKEKILEERLKEIESTNERIIENTISDIPASRNMAARYASNLRRKIDVQIRKELNSKETISDENLLSLIESATKSLWWTVTERDNYNELIGATEQIYNNTKEILNLPEETIVLEIVSRYFNRVFHSQIDPLLSEEDFGSEVTINIKGKEEKLFFKNSYCNKFIDNVKIMHKAIYIDNPFVIDELSGFRYHAVNPMNELLIDLLIGKSQEGVMDGVIESVRIKEKLNDIYKTLQTVVGGEILLNQSNGEYYLKNNELDEPISFHNLSTGVKSFVILKMLLEQGRLREKDIVILDEPEIHLHPQWQIAYAELIVLLQKHFDLSVVVTTHSPYFVDALHLYSCKYGIDKKVHYYLSTNSANTVTMEPVTGKIDLIYKKMASPIQILDTLRYELNNN